MQNELQRLTLAQQQQQQQQQELMVILAKSKI